MGLKLAARHGGRMTSTSPSRALCFENFVKRLFWSLFIGVFALSGLSCSVGDSKDSVASTTASDTLGSPARDPELECLDAPRIGRVISEGIDPGYRLANPKMVPLESRYAITVLLAAVIIDLASGSTFQGAWIVRSDSSGATIEAVVSVSQASMRLSVWGNYKYADPEIARLYGDITNDPKYAAVIACSR